jgi:hypothetical protein
MKMCVAKKMKRILKRTIFLEEQSLINFLVWNGSDGTFWNLGNIWFGKKIKITQFLMMAFA